MSEYPEAEAKTKWCVASRMAWIHVVEGHGQYIIGANRYHWPPIKENPATLAVIPPGATCIGSQCNSWRWVDPQMTKGYCGLAGKP